MCQVDRRDVECMPFLDALKASTVASNTRRPSDSQSCNDFAVGIPAPA